MIEQTQLDKLRGSDVYGADGNKIGSLGQIYLDDASGQPEWATVNTGLFGMKESFIPLRDATASGDSLKVPYDKDKVKGAPTVDDDAHLDPHEERELYAYYGVDYGSTGDVTSRPGTDEYAASGPRTEGHDTSGRTTDDAMTRSEERLDVGTRSEEVGRARLRKYVVTEHETHTVPVRKERAVIETEPVTDSNVGAATGGPEISEEEHEVVLSEERPVVGKTTEPVERVRLGTEETTEQETVSEEVRKERIEAEGDVTGRDTGTR